MTDFDNSNLKSKASAACGWNFIVLMSRQGKIRLSEFFSSYTEAEKRRILRDIAADVLPRQAKMCNIIEKGSISSFIGVCELDLVFSLHKSLMILFEMFIGGMLCESNRREVLQQIVEAEEMVEAMTKPGEDTSSQLDDGLSFQEQFQLGRKPGARGPRGNR
ncbi:hypothetical protein HJC23_006789 [Cyclotella cryptica]|uniref:AP complex mu/sigma subunit domain-containing protein n=1 Tax=Cyclotella cryptica TaxID=29204 RepID=A0ABD3PFY4_9STRA|eukprot:CCRYP_015123-RA/>CCRYP_015123-RA protein AED:0.11 eAED:0.11 QI:116/0/1/1/1/1/2/1785/161